jgi:hypothetical protein
MIPDFCVLISFFSPANIAGTTMRSMVDAFSGSLSGRELELAREWVKKQIKAFEAQRAASSAAAPSESSKTKVKLERDPSPFSNLRSDFDPESTPRAGARASSSGWAPESSSAATSSRRVRSYRDLEEGEIDEDDELLSSPIRGKAPARRSGKGPVRSESPVLKPEDFRRIRDVISPSDSSEYTYLSK